MQSQKKYQKQTQKQSQHQAQKSRNSQVLHQHGTHPGRTTKGHQSQKSRKTQERRKSIQQHPDASLLSVTPVPTDEELPDWAHSGVRQSMRPPLYDRMHQTFGQHVKGGSFEAKYGLSKEKTSLPMCTVVVKAGDQEWKAVAEAHTKTAARDTAMLLVLAQMTAQGADGDLFPLTSAQTKHLESKKHQLLDVFNYAANLGAVPSVTLTHAERLKLKYYQYSISLPEQNIRVSAVAKSRTLAETAACLKFKKAAGRHVVNSDAGDLAVQSSESLNSHNAAKFLGWLTNRHRRSCSVKAEMDAREGVWYGQGFYTSGSEKRSTPLIPSCNKGYAEEAATIHAAVSISKDEPALFRQFIEELIEGKGHLLEVSRPLDLEISARSQYAIQDTLRIPGLRQLAQGVQDAEDTPEPQVSRNRINPLPEEQKRLLSPRLKSLYERYLNSDKMAGMRKLKSELPMNQYKSQVTKLVQDNVYSIIIGATGSGKTTQVPQIILEKYYQEDRGADCNIICTQPRRIAAISVARRVADELGPDLKNRVGYHVRFDARLPAQGGSVTYCTTGILLQQLQYEPDAIFDHVSHLMIDEVHERDKIIDFTLTVLKRAVTHRLARGLKVPRITLMSATLDTDLFANYFKNLDTDGQLTEAPVLSVPGRTFPVSEKHLADVLAEIRGRWPGSELGLLRNDRNSTKYIEMEDTFAGTYSNQPLSEHQDTDIVSTIDWKFKPVYDDAGASSKDSILPAGLIATTIAHVLRTSTQGAVLVFLPGLAEIQAIEKLLTTQSLLGVNVSDQSKYKLFLLHSSISDSQKTVFDPPPEGVRKVILSTNIAETSVTIPDVQYVIDTGKVRQIQYDNSTRVSWLQNAWISKSNAKQRAGRAGRVQNGHYLALYSKSRHQAMPAIGVPELLRSDLQSTCLSVKATIRGVGVTDFLADAIDPPDPPSVKEALARLVALDALTPDHANLTALGKLLASLPVHPVLGKMIILGIMFKCLDPILVIGAAAEERGLFVMAPEVKARSFQSKVDFAGETGSDHLAIYNAFCHVRQYYTSDESHARRVAQSVDVHFGAWRAIHHASQQIRDILQEAGVLRQQESADRDLMIGGPAWNINSHKPHIVKAILLAGLQPNIGLKRKASHRLVLLGDRPAAEPSNFSVLRGLRGNEHALGDNSLVAFTSVAKSTDGRSYSLRELSTVTPLAVALFGGTTDVNENPGRSNILVVNKWLQLFIRGSASSRRHGSSGHSALSALRMNLDRVLKVAFENLANGQIKEKMAAKTSFAIRRNGWSESDSWAGDPTLLKADQKASIASDFLRGVVRVLDGDESTAAEGGFNAPLLGNEFENFPTYAHAKRSWLGRPTPHGRNTRSSPGVVGGHRARNNYARR